MAGPPSHSLFRNTWHSAWIVTLCLIAYVAVGLSWIKLPGPEADELLFLNVLPLFGSKPLHVQVWRSNRTFCFCSMPKVWSPTRAAVNGSIMSVRTLVCAADRSMIFGNGKAVLSLHCMNAQTLPSDHEASFLAAPPAYW